MPENPLKTKYGKRRARECPAKKFAQIARKKIAPTMRQKLASDAADPTGGAMAANRGNGKQQRGEKRGEHQESVRTVSTRVMSQSPPIFWKVNFISCT